jgi:hydrophobe/amphiphile efflux-3 (HAE3) family protein
MLLTGRRGAAIAIGLLVTVVLGFGATRLEFRTGQDSYLDKDEPVYRDSLEYQSYFGGQAMLSVFTVKPGGKLENLFTPGNVARWTELREKLDANPRIESAVTPLTALEFTDNLVDGKSGDLLSSPAAKILIGARERDPDPGSQLTRFADAITTLKRYNEVPVAERSFDNPAWVKFLLYDNSGEIRKSLRAFFPNEQNAQMIVRLAGNASIEEEGKGARVVEDAMAGVTFDNASVVTTGAPVLLRDINDYLRGGFLKLGGIALALMAGLLLVGFAVRWRLLPLGVVAVGLVWAFGLAGYIGVPLSVVTISGLPVLLGIGIDFAVQLHSRVEEEGSLGRAADPPREALTRLAPALVVATVAGVLAFLALRFSEVPMIRDCGVLLAIGLPAVVLAAVLLTTGALGWREQRSPTQPRDYTRGLLGHLVVGLGSLPRATALPLTVISVAVFVGGIYVADDLKIQADPVEWVDQSSQVAKDITEVRNLVGSSSELGVFVESENVFDDTTVGYADAFAREQLAKHPGGLLTVSSIVTTVSFLMDIPDTTYVPPTGADVTLAYKVAPDDIQRSSVKIDNGALNMIFRTGPGSLDERAVIVNDIRAAVNPPEGVTATPSGLAVVGAGLLKNFEANRVELTYYALAAVFAFLFIRYFSLTRALLSMVPVLIAVGLASLVSWQLGFELSPLTALGGPLVIALCTEFTSLIITRYLEERDRGHAPREAVDATAARTGRAFGVSALAAVTGILALGSSSLPLLRNFGHVVALNVGLALLCALVVLPPLLVWADELGWVYREHGGRAGTAGTRQRDHAGGERGRAEKPRSRGRHAASPRTRDATVPEAR